MSDLYRNNLFAIGLLIVGALLAVISVVGYVFNPVLFSSFSWAAVIFIFSIAGYMVYNMKKIANEMKKRKK